MNQKTVFVVSGGSIGDPAFLRARIEAVAPVEMICADGGARHLEAIGLVPQAIIGDMDSLDPDLLQRFEEQGSRILRHPADKDKTDTWLALEYALDREPERVLIFGALGGRIDHTLANISLLALAEARGVRAAIIDEWCEAFLVSGGGTVVIDGERGQTVSLLPLAAAVTGITLGGFAYPLKDGTMELGRPYGISNRLTAERATVTVAGGMLLVVRYFQAGVFPAGG